MKKTLLVCLLSAGSLFFSNQLHAQTCDITLNAAHVNTTTPDQNSTFVLLANTHYCVTGDQSNIIGNRKIKIENGATLTINSGAKFKVNQFLTPSATDGVFKVNVNGKLLFEQSNIETNGVDIIVGNGGFVGAEDWQGNPLSQDIKFANTSNNNKIFVQQGGEIKANVITFGKNNTGGHFEVDNYGLITTAGNINMDATTIFRNPGEIQVGQSFNQNATSKFINCGEIFTGTSFNIGGGEVINTNLFISHDSRIDFGNVAGGIFRNYAVVEVKSLNISSTQNSGYFYNEGIVELKETGNNVFGSNVGKIKGPESAAKRGYFILKFSRKSCIG